MMNCLSVLSIILQVSISVFIILVVLHAIKRETTTEHFSTTTSPSSDTEGGGVEGGGVEGGGVEGGGVEGCGVEGGGVEGGAKIRAEVLPIPPDDPSRESYPPRICLDSYDDPDPNPVFLENTWASINMPSHVGTLLPRFQFIEEETY
jgi:hypothetical protein